ncbi:type 1 glutamine amidotransferase [Nocardioides sp.]|uniref:type 1 glutamine amidotransferase n=1 Tax=Nocardioides sp. TaxID=35761 RepID=UPI003D1382C6
MTKKALVIQHDHVSPPGPVGARLAERGYDVELLQLIDETDFHDPGVSVELPEATAYDVIVPMGAIWSAYDEELIGSWLLPELDLLRAADAAGVAVLGICFGGQLLSIAHGGRVSPSPRPELGWVQVEADEPDLVPSGPWFQWHNDRWSLPAGAREIARNDAASQAWVLRRNLALQFHPELTADMLEGWLSNGGAAAVVAHGQDVEQLRAVTAGEDAAARRRAGALVDAFLDRVASSPLS